MISGGPGRQVMAAAAAKAKEETDKDEDNDNNVDPALCFCRAILFGMHFSTFSTVFLGQLVVPKATGNSR